MEVRNCIVCYKEISDVEKGVQVEDNDCGECPSLKSQLQVIFMMQKFLKISKETCTQFLQDYGDPCSWIIWCDSCSVLVKRAKTCFDEIVSLQIQFAMLRLELKNLVCQSEQERMLENTGRQLENRLPNGLTDIVRAYIIKGGESFTNTSIQIKVEIEESSDFTDMNCPCMDIKEDLEQNDFALPEENLEIEEEECKRKTYDQQKEIKTAKKSSRQKVSNGEVIDSIRNIFNDDSSSTLECGDNLEPGDKGSESEPFLTIQDMKEHSAIHEIDGQYSCKICGKKFRQECSLRRHERNQTCVPAGTQHNCTDCHEEFDQFRKLKKHSAVVHGVELNKNKSKEKFRKKSEKSRVQCSLCGKMFSRLQELKRHFLIHTGERPHSCPICERTFTQSGEVTIHVRTHTGEKPFRCSECGKGYKTKAELRTHSIVHSGQPREKPFLCSFCGKTFAQLTKLNQHLSNHTGEKPFFCETCGHRTNNFQTLQRHLLTHTGKRPYPCTMCEKKFPTPSQLKLHIRTHTGEKPFLCIFCGKSFADNNNLKKHSKIHEKEISAFLDNL